MNEVGDLMPELPEVETVKNALKKEVLNKKITSVKVYWDNIIAFPNVEEFKKQLKSQTINNIKRRGKWLMFELDDYYLLSHLRMEGKYLIRKTNEPKEKHQHVIFSFSDNTDLRYHDTRKFGKMYLIKKNDIYNQKPLKDLGLEPWDNDLTSKYLKQKLKDKPIKTELLDQSIITGIGNIYADEILFKAKINPQTKAKSLAENDLENIIKYTRQILTMAIKDGGTTIKSYTSQEGVHGKYQDRLQIHTKKTCPICKNKIKKITVNGRGTYYCENCQKER